ncbi:L-threonine 3-dehydrogenase [Candidatus Bathyarchaeota archaeon]|nr:MAG: L-threonine 3-dehydrogenase [Candidatus Bathyarchaeota archaeon]RJS81285.1 MAG: L-threonine 3-dehydrogenase [Candidatus Bathyarchaeota archaeon]
MSKEKILVTGATGQIGSELTLKLRKKYGNDNVVAAGHKRKPSEKLLESGPFVYLDVTDKEAIEKVVKEYEIDTIYHLAAVLSAIGEEKPQLAWHVNINGLYNVLEVTREHGVQRVFWPSSIAVFGPEAPRVNTPQNTVLIPRTVYGVTKVAGELLCNYYFTKFGVDVRSVRYPGIISSETLPGGGTTDYAVEIFYEAIKHRRYVCFVREDTVLPMMYMPDCLKAALDLMEADADKITCRTSYNVSAMSFSAGELVAEIKKYIPGFTCEFKPDFRQKIADSWPMSIDDSAARRDWGWKPAYDLAAMTRDMIEKLTRKLAEGNA